MSISDIQNKKEVAKDNQLLDVLATTKVGNTTITLDELKQIQADVNAIDIPLDVLQKIAEIRSQLYSKMITPSDRRFVECLEYIKAEAYLKNRKEVEVEDLITLVDCLWEDYDRHYSEVRQILSTCRNQNLVKLDEWYDAAKVKFDSLRGSKTPQTIIETVSALKQSYLEIEKIAKKDKPSFNHSRDMIANIKGWSDGLMKEIGIGL